MKCSCEESTRCYECLRTFGNQRLHSHLQRGIAKRFLENALGSEMQLAGDRLAQTFSEEVFSSILNSNLAERIRSVVQSGYPMPDMFFELVDEQGIVRGEAELAWPVSKIAVLSPAQETDSSQFQAAGWQTITSSEVIKSADILADLLESARS